MRAVAEENRSFLQDIALALPFEQFREQCTLQEHESALYLALSDMYESVEDEERIRMCRHWPNVELRTTPGLLVEIRSSSLYAMLKAAVVKIAAELSEEVNQDGREWIRSKRAMARKKIVRTIAQGDGRKALLAATEIVDRDMPKQPRSGGNSSTVIVFRPEDAERMNKALSVVQKETKLIGPSSDE